MKDGISGILTVADLHSKILDARPPPGGPNSFNFMQFSGKIGKIVCWRPPGELAPPPRGNPGSATDLGDDPLSHLSLITLFRSHHPPGLQRFNTNL